MTLEDKIWYVDNRTTHTKKHVDTLDEKEKIHFKPALWANTDVRCAVEELRKRGKEALESKREMLDSNEGFYYKEQCCINLKDIDDVFGFQITRNKNDE